MDTYPMDGLHAIYPVIQDYMDVIPASSIVRELSVIDSMIVPVHRSRSLVPMM